MIKDFITKFIPSLGSVLLCFGLLSAGKFMEPIVMPVVEDFQISDISYQSDKVIVSGSMNQKRSCTFIDMTAYAIYENKQIPKDLLKYEFVDIGPRARSIGNQKWGPWKIELPVMTKASQIELTATYRCHYLWDTHMVLTKFLVV